MARSRKARAGDALLVESVSLHWTPDLDETLSIGLVQLDQYLLDQCLTDSRQTAAIAIAGRGPGR